MRDEVDHLLSNRGACEAEQIPAWDRGDALNVRDELLAMIGELEARAGQPEPMKSAAAEKMRCKLEIKLLPQLRVQIPKWAERLRYFQAKVLKWVEPEGMNEPVEQLESTSTETYDDGFAQLFLDELEQERLRAEEKSAMLGKKKELKRLAKQSLKNKGKNAVCSGNLEAGAPAIPVPPVCVCLCDVCLCLYLYPCLFPCLCLCLCLSLCLCLRVCV